MQGRRVRAAPRASRVPNILPKRYLEYPVHVLPSSTLCALEGGGRMCIGKKLRDAADEAHPRDYFLPGKPFTITLTIPSTEVSGNLFLSLRR